MAKKQAIYAVYAGASEREVFFREYAIVGDFGVTEIVERFENGLLWFDVLIGEKVAVAFNALHVKSVLYDLQEPAL